jgi:hypothetical protein
MLDLKGGPPMDPFTLSLAITFFGGLALAIIAITVKRIYQWFQARGKIKAENSRVLAFTLAERINNKKYVEVQGVFSGRSEPTRIVQGFYDTENERIIDARALASSSRPDRQIVEQHDEGDGLVIYS